MLNKEKNDILEAYAKKFGTLNFMRVPSEICELPTDEFYKRVKQAVDDGIPLYEAWDKNLPKGAIFR